MVAQALLDKLLERKIVNPHATLSSTDEKVVNSIMLLFDTEPLNNNKVSSSPDGPCKYDLSVLYILTPSVLLLQ
jgi:hypothetical protein